jgi:hypothetical protein
MTITARHRAAARRRRAATRTTLATRPVVPANRYSAPLQAISDLRRR